MTTQEQNITHSYSDEELSEFKQNIEIKLEKATKELTYLKSLKPEEAGKDVTQEQIDQMINRQSTFVGNLYNALARIEDKTYGICRVTGKLIDKARLTSVPHATLSIEAKVAQNQAPPAPAEKPARKKSVKSKTTETTISLGNSEVPVNINEEDLKKIEEKTSARYSDDDLRNFKTLISNKIDEASDELKYLHMVLTDRHRGIKIEGYEDMPPAEVEALIDRKKSYISELESAIDRVKKKTYGIDEGTGELIPKEALLRLPILRRLNGTPEHASVTIQKTNGKTKGSKKAASTK